MTSSSKKILWPLSRESKMMERQSDTGRARRRLLRD